MTVLPGMEAAPARRLPPGPLAWRLATRVTLAAALAMAGGMALSPQRWFWAVITVYVVFLNTRSRGDTIYKGVQRLGGTLLGMVSGLVLATLVAGHGGLETIVLMLAIFGMFYLFLVSYTAGVFCVTVMLGFLYGLLGASVEPVLLLRLEETAIGAAAAVLVAAFVLPARTRDQVMQSGRNVLAALVETVQASREALSGIAGAAPMEAVRRVDRQVTDLRLALAPLTAGRLLRRRTALERPVPALLACVHWARVLAAVSQVGATTPDAAALAGRAAQIEARLAGLAGVKRAPGSLAPSQEPADSAPRADGADPDSPAAVPDNLEAAVERLAKRLEAGALEGFALDP